MRILENGECVSLSGTHLGHNLPDRKGNRYCINLVSVAGRPDEEKKKEADKGDTATVTEEGEVDWQRAKIFIDKDIRNKSSKLIRKKGEKEKKSCH